MAAGSAGFVVDALSATAITFRDVELADQILGVRRNAERAVAAGLIEAAAARQWVDRLTGGGPFLACVTLFTVTAVR